MQNLETKSSRPRRDLRDRDSKNLVSRLHHWWQWIECNGQGFIRDTDAKLVFYHLLFWQCRMSAVSGVTRCLGQELKCIWKRSTVHCRGVASNTQKNPEKWRWIRMWVAILKPNITNKYSENAKKYWNPKGY